MEQYFFLNSNPDFIIEDENRLVAVYTSEIHNGQLTCDKTSHRVVT